jgi:hypothetical protein
MNEQADPFDAFETSAEIFAFVFKKGGARDLRRLLDMPPGERATREYLEATAAELEQVGLPQVAAIVAEYAPTRPSRLDLCPHEPGSTDAKFWLDSERRKLARKR